MDRSFKQIIIFAVFAIIIGGIVWLLILALGPPKPTCQDSIKNQNEEGIDCGGICTPCNVERPIEVVSVDVIIRKDGLYDVLARIRNNNPNLGSGDVPYVISVVDLRGNVVNTFSGVTYIMPSQEKYIIANANNFRSDIAGASIKIGDMAWSNSPTILSPDIVIVDKNLVIDQGSTRVYGLLKNNSNYNFDKVEVNIILQSNGKPVAIAKTTIGALLSGENRGFFPIWPYVLTEAPDDVEVEAFTNLFDINNYSILEVQPKPQQ